MTHWGALLLHHHAELKLLEKPFRELCARFDAELLALCSLAAGVKKSDRCLSSFKIYFFFDAVFIAVLSEIQQAVNVFKVFHLFSLFCFGFSQLFIKLVKSFLFRFWFLCVL